ncbi:MarR family winged helix-turn-helix transcriptional regulator [Companilactobacillus sp.]|jgi:DNA-binding MarR family transcriptional regulator|uniref:MarR family winged helix-turn-helix transcriptional regulator n=1 Tax=Companilactobacillus sp. TaxID=2767905 RepID=UPI0025C55EE8|nr:MarR family winged helix-turn-helix transcriptional regulator [Companilactobacillus sp.]MCH4010040.1 MarR family winged helix-turn-helix transcriptional regulator [Companilactobacillus sp.]MCH4052284.1 MarR family winged helix-turn-helix transcriptional regulator [Companilactobacillus sp.]MCH4077982.1 MarR family winged helix-turn-helix transcriptional regulator [Companilactobacillus sp.]MCH4126558.1 MarR family winged helix-turn-helix transcriptional regulator [Companilactobacillus sp.]MCH
MYKGFSKKTKRLEQLINKKVSQVFAQSGVETISYSSFSVLEYLETHQDSNVFQKDIERALSVNRATASKMIKLLTKKGYVSQKPFSEDARYKLLFLTDTGRALYQADVKAASNLDQFFNDVLSTEDFEAFDRMYEKLEKELSK